MLRIIDGELIIYDFRMINYKIEEKPFIIFNLPKEMISYHEE